MRQLLILPVIAIGLMACTPQQVEQIIGPAARSYDDGPERCASPFHDEPDLGYCLGEP